jgi:hypothetical protein
MKRHLIVTACAILAAGPLIGIASADLAVIGTATWSEPERPFSATYNLIWESNDDGKSLVWLDYTNPKAHWAGQTDWAAELGTFLTDYDTPGYSVDWTGDWRLPAYDPQNEMASLYSENSFGTAGFLPFAELKTDDYYWTNDGGNIQKYTFLFEDGTSSTRNGNTGYAYGLAVREATVTADSTGPVPVPVPGAALLGVIGLSVAGSRLRRKTA